MLSDAYHVAVIVGGTTVVTQKAQGVVFFDMLRVLLHEFLDTIPKRWNGLDILVQTKNKTVFLALVFHLLEWIVVNVAEELNAGLYSPVVFELVHQLVSEEESRLEATHMAVADGIAVDDLALGHVLSRLLCLFLINEVGERPLFFRNKTIVCFARDERSRDAFEIVVKRLVVEEHPVVVIIPVESILDLANRPSNLPCIGVPGECDERRIDSGPGSRKTSC